MARSALRIKVQENDTIIDSFLEESDCLPTIEDDVNITTDFETKFDRFDSNSLLDSRASENSEESVPPFENNNGRISFSDIGDSSGFAFLDQKSNRNKILRRKTAATSRIPLFLQDSNNESINVSDKSDDTVRINSDGDLPLVHDLVNTIMNHGGNSFAVGNSRDSTAESVVSQDNDTKNFKTRKTPIKSSNFKPVSILKKQSSHNKYKTNSRPAHKISMPAKIIAFFILLLLGYLFFVLVRFGISLVYPKKPTGSIFTRFLRSSSILFGNKLKKWHRKGLRWCRSLYSSYYSFYANVLKSINEKNQAYLTWGRQFFQLPS